VNEETDYYSDPFDYYEEIEKHQVFDRYAKGYVSETKNSPIREEIREKGASNDLDAFLGGLDDESYNRGYTAGQTDTEHELLEDIRGLENTVDRLEDLLSRQDTKRLDALESENTAVKKLRDEAVKEKQAVLAELSYFLGTILDTNPTPTDDVEAWAFQDGNNQAIIKVQEWVESLNKARELIEGTGGPTLKKLPKQDMNSFKRYPPEQEDDDDDWPPF
jgi:hypothetical protein